MAKQNKPDVVSLTPEEAEAFKNRVINSSLAESDQKIVLALLSFSFWPQIQLSRAKLTILRLKKIFGLPTEKKSAKKIEEPSEPATVDESLPPTEANAPNDETTASAVIHPQPKEKPKPRFDPDQNHGRYAASDYTGCPIVPIFHESLNVGDNCPACAEASQHGKLYALLPQMIVQLQGSPIITGTRYACEKLRCALCNTHFVAELPDEIAGRQKYDETSRSAIAIARYYTGLPFKRLETLQKLQGIPLADATQLDQVNKLHPITSVVLQAMEACAAQGQLIKLDDTGNRILEAQTNKKAVHTTAFISTFGSHDIYLFYTSQRYAAQNLELLITDRTSEEQLYYYVRRELTKYSQKNRRKFTCSLDFVLLPGTWPT